MRGDSHCLLRQVSDWCSGAGAYAGGQAGLRRRRAVGPLPLFENGPFSLCSMAVGAQGLRPSFRLRSEPGGA